MNAKALLLSAYDAKSHCQWRQRVTQMFPAISWQQLSLPPRNFNWRIRGNSLQWALSNRAELSENYDFLLATSMVDLSSLRGLVPNLTKIPNIVYFHENQFAYPLNQQRNDNIEPLLVPLYSAFCADKVAFNSKYNQQTFLEGARNLFDKLPDHLPKAALKKLEESLILPVPVNAPQAASKLASSNSLLSIVWNHRWEYDKGPKLLLEIVRKIASLRMPVQFHIVGESFRNTPSSFDQIKSILLNHSERLSFDMGRFGYITNEVEYYQMLANCDVVLSTAEHDFQGLAIQEACLSGCSPLAPDRLVYPEYLRSECLYSAANSIDDSANAAVAKISLLLSLKQSGKELPKVDMSRFSSNSLLKDYQALFDFSV